MEKVQRLYAEAMRRVEVLRGLPMTERRRRRVARLLGLTRAWNELLRRGKAGELLRAFGPRLGDSQFVLQPALRSSVTVAFKLHLVSAYPRPAG